MFDAIDEVRSAPIKALATIKRLVKQDSVDVNLKYNSGWSLLHELATFPKGFKIIPFLLDNGADIEIMDTGGDTPLNYAVLFWNEENVKLLIDRGANINSRNNDGWTVLHLAVHHQDPKTIKLLLANGADRDIQDNEDRTALDIAIQLREVATKRREEKTYDKIIDILLQAPSQ